MLYFFLLFVELVEVGLEFAVVGKVSFEMELVLAFFESFTDFLAQV